MFPVGLIAAKDKNKHWMPHRLIGRAQQNTEWSIKKNVVLILSSRLCWITVAWLLKYHLSSSRGRKIDVLYSQNSIGVGDHPCTQSPHSWWSRVQRGSSVAWVPWCPPAAPRAVAAGRCNVRHWGTVQLARPRLATLGSRLAWTSSSSSIPEYFFLCRIKGKCLASL